VRPQPGDGGLWTASGDAHDEDRSAHGTLPIRVEFVESAEKVDDLLPTLYDMLTDGLIEVQDTTIVKSVIQEHLRSNQSSRTKRSAGKAG